MVLLLFDSRLITLPSFFQTFVPTTAILTFVIVLAKNNFADLAENTDFHDIGKPSWYWELSENPSREIGGSQFFYYTLKNHALWAWS